MSRKRISIKHVVLFFIDAATPRIYTLSLHDALPICTAAPWRVPRTLTAATVAMTTTAVNVRSEEHTSELQSHSDLVCRLLLEKKKKIRTFALSLLRSRTTNFATFRYPLTVLSPRGAM